MKVKIGNGPIMATAIHDGHKIRDEVERLFAISDADRLREEDPYSGRWTEIAPTSIVVEFSRFQVDLNRPREKAVYINPEDAWGLHVWKEKPSSEIIVRSLDEYDKFYAKAHEILSNLENKFENIVILDLHTYNYRRNGTDGPPANSEENPEINIGTGTMDRERWGAVVDSFMNDLRSFDFLGRHLDVRENVKFKGGHFSNWIHRNFPNSCCSIAVEVKKFFMDEWTGVPDDKVLGAVHNALESTVPGILEELSRLRHRP